MEKMTVIQQVIKAIKEGARKPAEINKIIGAKPSQVYNALDSLRRQGVIVKGTKGYYIQEELPLNKTKAKRTYTKRKPTLKEDMAVLGREILKGRNALANLLDENERLHTLIQERDNTITALKIDMLDQQAVINYLEKKLIK